MFHSESVLFDADGCRENSEFIQSSFHFISLSGRIIHLHSPSHSSSSHFPSSRRLSSNHPSSSHILISSHLIPSSSASHHYLIEYNGCNRRRKLLSSTPAARSTWSSVYEPKTTTSPAAPVTTHTSVTADTSTMASVCFPASVAKVPSSKPVYSIDAVLSDIKKILQCRLIDWENRQRMRAVHFELPEGCYLSEHHFESSHGWMRSTLHYPAR